LEFPAGKVLYKEAVGAPSTTSHLAQGDAIALMRNPWPRRPRTVELLGSTASDARWPALREQARARLVARRPRVWFTAYTKEGARTSWR